MIVNVSGEWKITDSYLYFLEMTYNKCVRKERSKFTVTAQIQK